jgi:hypothetical protein
MQLEPNAPANFSNFTSLTTDPVNALLANNQIMVYPGGQCFYRSFIRNPDASPSEINSVLRNHIYVVDVTEIKGPGIDDPSDFVIPTSNPIMALDTYVTAKVHVLDWHRVISPTLWDGY